MILSDQDIRSAIGSGWLEVSPLGGDAAIQPASIDIRLGKRLLVPDGDGTFETVMRREYALCPGDFVLGTTLEYVRLPDNLVARIEGRSSLGRQGLLVHVTAGFVDPGFSGELTLELFNLSRRTIYLRPGQPIAQLSFERLSSPCERPYGHPDLGSHYQGQTGPTASRT